MPISIKDYFVLLLNDLFFQIPAENDDQKVFLKPVKFGGKLRKYTNEERYALGKLVAEFKTEYEKQCQRNTKLVPSRNKRQSSKPKDGYLSKAIRHHYSDLEKAPSSDPNFKRALSLGKRSHDFYLNHDPNETPSKKRFKSDGAGRKTVAVDVRLRLFEWFIG